MQTPTHVEALGFWSNICDRTAADAVVLLVPQPEMMHACAFQPTEEQPLNDWCEEAIHGLLDMNMVTEEAPWAALIAPSFTIDRPVAEADTVSHGDLQQRYADGDESIREVVLVIIQEMDQPPYGQTFSQPLLEPLDEPAVMAPGPMTLSLFSVLMHAAFPEDFKHG